MTQGETRKPLPTAERMIGEAITIALDATSGELALRRGELLLGIARELRAAADERRKQQFAEAILMPKPIATNVEPPAPPVNRQGLDEARLKLREQSVPAGVVRAAAEERDDEALRRAFAEAAGADRDLLAEAAGMHPGGAPCWHGWVNRPHPANAGFNELMKGVAAEALGRAGLGGDTTQRIEALPWAPEDRSECRFCGTPIRMNEFAVWVHKYTDQTVCATPVTAEQIEADAVPEHTYATPATVRKGV